MFQDTNHSGKENISAKYKYARALHLSSLTVNNPGNVPHCMARYQANSPLNVDVIDGQTPRLPQGGASAGV